MNLTKIILPLISFILLYSCANYKTDKIIQNKECIKVSTKLHNTTMNISNKNRVLKLYKIPKIETSICN